MANSANSPSVINTPVVVPDPASPVAVALADVKSAETTLDPVLGVAPDAATAKAAPHPKHAALSLIPIVLQAAVAEPYLAPKGVDPKALLDELTLLQGLNSVASEAGTLKLRVDRTVKVRMGKIWDAVQAILGVAEHTPGDTKGADLVVQMQKALARGPRVQKSVRTKLVHPSPKGKKAEKLLANQALEAQQAATHPAEPPASPAAAPAEASGGTSSSGGSTPNAKG